MGAAWQDRALGHTTVQYETAPLHLADLIDHLKLAANGYSVVALTQASTRLSAQQAEEAAQTALNVMAQVTLLCQLSVYSFLLQKARQTVYFFKKVPLSLPNVKTCGILLCGIPEGGTSMKQLQPSETLPVGLLLALAGGLLDGYSYLNRGQVFATAETGNIVLMGINLAQGQLDQALHYLLPILAFALGVLAAEQLRRRFGDSPRLHWRLPLLLAECGAILLVSCLPCGPLDPLANIIISFTSALQVESFRKFQGCGCVTTMCTGNLRSGTEHLFHWFFHR